MIDQLINFLEMKKRFFYLTILFVISFSFVGNLLLKDYCNYNIKINDKDVVAFKIDSATDSSNEMDCSGSGSGCNCHCHHNHFSFVESAEGFSISKIDTEDFYSNHNPLISFNNLSQKRPPKLVS